MKTVALNDLQILVISKDRDVIRGIKYICLFLLDYDCVVFSKYTALAERRMPLFNS